MTREKRTVLVIDDSLVIQRLVQSRLRADGFEVTTTNSGMDGLRLARQLQPDVILLDVDMPGLSGYETCKELKNDAQTRFIPVIFLTAQAKTDDKVRGLDLGAIDYVTKPFDPVELRARVRSAHRLKYLLELLEQKAQIDGLTGLYNRAFFDDRILQELERARRYNSPLALVMLDVDKFKNCNDTYGHSFGDMVLAEVADTLRAHARTMDIVARYGGEEFVIILPEQDSQGASVFSNRVRQSLEGLNLHHSGEAVRVTASFGVSATPETGYEQVETLVNAADKALYSAKHGGRNRVHVWSGTEPYEYIERSPAVNT